LTFDCPRNHLLFPGASHNPVLILENAPEENGCRSCPSVVLLNPLGHDPKVGRLNLHGNTTQSLILSALFKDI